MHSNSHWFSKDSPWEQVSHPFARIILAGSAGRRSGGGVGGRRRGTGVVQVDVDDGGGAQALAMAGGVPMLQVGAQFVVLMIAGGGSVIHGASPCGYPVTATSIDALSERASIAFGESCTCPFT